MSDFIFNFDDLKENPKTAPKPLLQVFRRAGASIAASWVNGKVKRESNISFKEITLVFTDNQEVVLRVKQTGDIFQFRLNKKAMPLKNQDDHKKAVAEILDALEKNRTRFQKQLAIKRVKLPAGIKSTVKRKEEALQEQITALDTSIAEAEEIKAKLLEGRAKDA